MIETAGKVTLYYNEKSYWLYKIDHRLICFRNMTTKTVFHTDI